MTQHPLRTRIATVGLAGLVLFAGSVGAYAANGGSLVLGHKNSATKTTTLKNKKGTALSLKSKAGTAPLKVSNNTLVTNLNADLVDGLDSTALQTKGYLYTLTANQATPVSFAFPGLPAGRYAVSYNLGAALSTGTAFQCFFIDSTTITGDLRFPMLATTGLPGNVYFSVSGELDTAAAPQPYRLVCSSNGGTITIPPPIGGGINLQSQVLFTPIDSLSATAATAGTFPKGAARSLN
jgi:hypothetical protein